jgi:hypothetical protein
MKFEDAIVESIKSFLAGNIPEKLNEMKEGGITYTPKWFDALEETVKKGGDLTDVTPEKGKKTKAEEETDMEIEGLGYAK